MKNERKKLKVDQNQNTRNNVQTKQASLPFTEKSLFLHLYVKNSYFKKKLYLRS